MKNFVAIEDHTKEELFEILDLAKEFQNQRYQDILKEKTLIALFLNPSTRTRTSFDLAITQLGGHCVTIEPGKGSWGIEIEEGAVMDGDSEEHLKEAVGVLARYADFLAIRCFPEFKNWEKERQDPILKNMVLWSDVPVVNMETITHPCQALAMMKTIRDHIEQPKRKKFVLTWAYHPKPLNTAVANSAGVGAGFLGMDVTIANPPGYDLDPYYLQHIEKQCKANGANFEIVHNMEEAFQGADFVYAKSWGALAQYGNFQPEIHHQYKDWIVDEKRMALTNDAFFSHCLPVRRNMIVSDAVIDSQRSLVLDEAENRLHVQKGVLTKLNQECYLG